VVVVVVALRGAGGDDASGVAVLDMAVVARAFNAFLPTQTSAVLSPDAVQYVALGAGKDNRPIERGNDFVITPVLHAGAFDLDPGPYLGPYPGPYLGPYLIYVATMQVQRLCLCVCLGLGLGLTGPHFPSIRSLACRPLPPLSAPFSPPSSRRVHTSTPGVVCLLLCPVLPCRHGHLRPLDGV